MQCNDEHFTCNDGTCILMEQRCDRLFDCKDKSDEDNCEIVQMHKESYIKEVPPFKHGQSVDIHVSILLLTINRIELPSTFNAKIKLNLFWKDYRLTFTNLQPNGNIIQKETRQNIWIPPLQFTNTPKRALLNDEETTISIIRTGSYKLNDIYELHEARVFKGDENMVRYSRNYQMDFKCEYELAFYPFDTQKCNIEMEIPEFFENYMDIFPNETGIIGSSKLEQFWITDVELISVGNNSEINCKIHLKRIPWFHITTTYMPIICVIAIVLSILFIDQSHFEATIMVALTAMLVMHTLFQSISASMPSTAYLKFLDYWLIFGLIMPFLVLITLVIWELNTDKIPSRITPVMYPYGRLEKPSAPMKCCKIFLPLLTIIFIISYFAFAVLVYLDIF